MAENKKQMLDNELNEISGGMPPTPGVKIPFLNSKKDRACPKCQKEMTITKGDIVRGQCTNSMANCNGTKYEWDEQNGGWKQVY